MDQMLNPVTPVPPNNPTRRPPTRAPAIPIRMVTMNPPGSSPGRISLPKAPAMSPTMIHEMIPTFSTLLSLELLYFSYNKSRSHRRDHEYTVHASGPGYRTPLSRGRTLHRRAVIHRPAAREPRPAHRRVAARRVYGVLDLPPLGLHEVLGESLTRPVHRRTHRAVPPVRDASLAASLEEITVHRGDIPLPAPLHHCLLALPAGTRD